MRFMVVCAVSVVGMVGCSANVVKNASETTASGGMAPSEPQPAPIEEQLAPLPKMEPAVEATQQPEPVAVTIDDQIHFHAKTATFRLYSYVVLSSVVETLKNYPEVHVELCGHTDSADSRRNHQALSVERARRVRTYLIRNGVDRDRLTAKGYGKRQPIASNATREGRAANRRVEFVVLDREEQRRLV